MTVEPYRIYQGDCLDTLKQWPDKCINCCITSPPYWGLRNYGVEGQLGLEKTPEEFIEKLVEIFREVRRVLRDDGTCWVNLGDSYAANSKGSGGPGDIQDRNAGSRYPSITFNLRMSGIKPKDLVGIPWMAAFALRADGWYLRQDIIWSKPNPMPESVTDRCTKSHEYIFLLTKSARYYYDHEAIKEDANPEYFSRYKYDFWPDGTKESNGCGRPNFLSNTGGKKQCYEKRNKRDVWNVSVHSFKGAHFATFPPDLIRPCVKAGCPDGGIILDPFIGAGTTAIVALQENKQYVGCELNPDYITMAYSRIEKEISKLIAKGYPA